MIGVGFLGTVLCATVMAAPPDGTNSVVQNEGGSIEVAIRPEVKLFIDAISGLGIVNIEHTTDSLSAPQVKRLPEEPKAFAAGRFKVTFGVGEEQRAIICQTEETVGHIASVTPGVTHIGGYIQLSENSQADFSSGPKLNVAELDYFLRMIYKKFCTPLSDAEAQLLNQLKDMALAIRFNSQVDLKEYHAHLSQECM